MESNHELLYTEGDIVRKHSCDEHLRPISFITEASYLLLPSWNILSPNANLEFSFRTTELNGLLCFHYGGSVHSSYFAVEIVDGILYVIFGVEKKPIRLKVSPEAVNDGLVHHVIVTISASHGAISVDMVSLSFVLSETIQVYNFGNRFYLGGLDISVPVNEIPLHVWTAMLNYGYIGCIQDVSVNRQPVDVAYLVKEQRVDGVLEGCRVQQEGACDDNPCYHDGRCIEGWNRYVCDCSATSYHDNLCQTGKMALFCQ